MHATARLGRRRAWLPLAALATAVALICAVAAWRPWTQISPPAASVDEAAAAPAPQPLALDDTDSVLIFGDSWVYGSAADVPTLGFAYRLAESEGWDAVVDGVRASGYLKPGIDGPDYGDRIAALDPDLDPDLVIVEGSINDRRLYPSGYRDAVVAAWDALGALYPDAQFVILGPAPQVLPVEKATAAIDADLAALAAARSWWYISPIERGWITAANYLDVIDTSEIGNDHPSTAGHAYLAERLAGALRELAAPTAVIADAPVGDDDATR